MKKLILCVAFLMAGTAPSFAGYYLTFGYGLEYGNGALTTIPFKHPDKASCEESAKVLLSGTGNVYRGGLPYICVPVDTHKANIEFD